MRRRGIRLCKCSSRTCRQRLPARFRRLRADPLRHRDSLLQQRLFQRIAFISIRSQATRIIGQHCAVQHLMAPPHRLRIERRSGFGAEIGQPHFRPHGLENARTGRGGPRNPGRGQPRVQMRDQRSRGLRRAQRPETNVHTHTAHGRLRRTPLRIIRGAPPVIAQRGKAALHRQRPRRGGQQLQRAHPPHGALTEVRVQRIPVTTRKIEVRFGAAPAFLDGVCHQPLTGAIPFPADGQPVGNGVHITNLQRGPVAPGGLQDPGLLWIGDEESIVIIRPMLIAAVAILPIGFQKRNQHIERRRCRGRAFQRQTHHVHAEQALIAVRLLGEDRLVANGDAMRVDAHLATPHPEGLAQ